MCILKVYLHTHTPVLLHLDYKSEQLIRSQTWESDSVELILLRRNTEELNFSVYLPSSPLPFLL